MSLQGIFNIDLHMTSYYCYLKSGKYRALRWLFEALSSELIDWMPCHQYWSSFKWFFIELIIWHNIPVTVKSIICAHTCVRVHTHIYARTYLHKYTHIIAIMYCNYFWRVACVELVLNTKMNCIFEGIVAFSGFSCHQMKGSCLVNLSDCLNVWIFSLSHFKCL